MCVVTPPVHTAPNLIMPLQTLTLFHPHHSKGLCDPKLPTHDIHNVFLVPKGGHIGLKPIFHQTTCLELLPADLRQEGDVLGGWFPLTPWRRTSGWLPITSCFPTEGGGASELSFRPEYGA